MVLLWQDVGFNRIRTVPNRCPTVARSMSAACCCSHSVSLPNRCPIHVSRILLLAEYVSAKPWPNPCQPHAVARRVHPPNRYLIYVSRMMLLAECVSAKPLPDLRQPHSVVRSIVRSMSAAWCRSQSMSQPNCCPIYVSRMMSLAEWVSAKPLPDLCQPHDVTRRVRLSQTVARSTSAT